MISRDRRLLAQPWIELSKRRTPEGTEKQCPCCGEWMPLNEENFSFISTRGHYHSHCRTCRAEDATRRRRATVMSRQINHHHRRQPSEHYRPESKTPA